MSMGGCVQLKELHSATRERRTAQSYCTSDTDRARSGPPLELLFKGGAQIEAKLVAELGRLRASGSLGTLTQVSAATSPTGSYNTADMLRYLDLVLDKWGPDRHWRILLCDAFSAHLSRDVQHFAWARGYLVV